MVDNDIAMAYKNLSKEYEMRNAPACATRPRHAQPDKENWCVRKLSDISLQRFVPSEFEESLAAS